MPAVDISGIFGPALIGLVVAAVLYGITSLQTYLYYVYYPKDRYELKFLVAAIWVLDTVQMVFACQGIYHYLITNYANPTALFYETWSLYTSVAINVFIAFVVQCFFTKRIIMLIKPMVAKIILGSCIASVVIARLAFGLETVVKSVMGKTYAHLNDVLRHGAATPFAVFAVVSDFVVAAALCVLLYKGRSDFKATNTLVHQLMVYAINRCLLTSVVAVVEATMYATRPDTLWFLSFDFAIGKLYANSLLATLNTRHSLRDSGTDSVIGEPQLTTVRFVGLSALERSVGSGSMADSYLEH